MNQPKPTGIKTVRYFEEMLENLVPDLDIVKDPARPGMFPIRMRTYTIYVFQGRIYLAPGTELTPAETPEKVPYTNATVGGTIDAVKIHFFDGIVPNVGGMTEGTIEMKMRTREPIQGDSEIQLSHKQVKIYEFYANVKAGTEAKSFGELICHRTTTTPNGTTIIPEYARRQYKDSAEGGHFAHFNYSDRQPRFQHVEVRLDRNNVQQPDRRLVSVGPVTVCRAGRKAPPGRFTDSTLSLCPTG